MGQLILIWNTHMRKCSKFIKYYECLLTTHLFIVDQNNDDGKIASESINITEEIKGEYLNNYKLSGNGYFRFVYRQRIYLLQYKVDGNRLNGKLGAIFVYIKHNFNRIFLL